MLRERTSRRTALVPLLLLLLLLLLLIRAHFCNLHKPFKEPMTEFRRRKLSKRSQRVKHDGNTLRQDANQC